MRNEILATYGYTFTEQEDREYFKNFSWYTPAFKSVQDFADSMSEIDKHNVAFLEEIILRLNSNLAVNI